MRSRRVTLVLAVIAIGVAVAVWQWPRQTASAGPTVTWDAATAHVVVAAANGRVLGSMDLARARDPAAASGQLPSNDGMVTLTGDQRRGYAFVAELDRGLIHALSTRDGHLLWQASLLPPSTPRNSQAAIQSPVVDEQAGRVISADIRDGRLVVMRESDGRRVAALPTRRGVWISLA